MNALFINENLTKQRKGLFIKAKLLKKKFNYQYLWTDKGEIYTRKNKEFQALKLTHHKTFLPYVKFCSYIFCKPQAKECAVYTNIVTANYFLLQI